MPPTLYLVAVIYEPDKPRLDFTARLKQAEQLALLNYVGHAANDARTVIAELLASACRTAGCWPRDGRTGQRLKRVQRLRTFCSALDMAGMLHPELHKQILRCKRIGDRGSHGKPVSTAAAFEAIEIAYRLLRFVETLWARYKPPDQPASGDRSTKAASAEFNKVQEPKCPTQ